MTDEEKKLNKAIKQDGIDTQSATLEELKRRYPQYAEQATNEQEIERMAEAIRAAAKTERRCRNADDGYHIGLEYYDYTPNVKEQAKTLIGMGIGDKKQAVKEAFKKLKMAICEGVYEDEDVHIENKWYMQKEFVGVIIDELFTELYVADE